MKEETDAYQTYVLRLWRARCRGRWQWRTSIESPQTGERQWFASLEQFCAFLCEQCERQLPDGVETPDSGRSGGVLSFGLTDSHESPHPTLHEGRVHGKEHDTC